MDYRNKKWENMTLLEGDKNSRGNLYLACSLMAMIKMRRKNCVVGEREYCRAEIIDGPKGQDLMHMWECWFQMGALMVMQGNKREGRVHSWQATRFSEEKLKWFSPNCFYFFYKSGHYLKVRSEVGIVEV